MNDEPVMATNDDASECKRGAVQLGYWQDSYIPYFVRQIEKRAPEINRGYYARVKGVERYIKSFLKKAGPASQIVNLGAGFDTLYWRLKDQGVYIANYVEIDFPTVTARKCYAIKRNKQLLERIHEQDGEVKLSATDLHAGNYHCMGADLRNISQVESKLQQAEVSFSTPTLFIAECVLVYIENDCVNRLLAWIASKFKSALFVNYEMCNMNDTFGDVMLGNLRARGCNLAGISFCKSLETQKGRFLDNNWQGAKAWDMVQIYYDLPASERQRIEKIEFLDEQELLIQLFQHYCICVGWLGTEFADVNCNGD
ncbi:leucine carboxyl methyltransferase 1 [Tribolium castaneum]|uniref:Leucine carboxyl methyltransferase 1 n=1 Tax=Tribolium castaneum TaxID=7070 RepID=D6W8H8_TRICA|nr:PREDICTED: leucine carboxyl methyltransferase 1 [Tribolium castaneum]EEZ98354.1 Leucine carboxyl methyltransferase 1-like Protein [Tribolium castaneum]|eukprot:XP_008201336.1 PREDICTED: leucine carboxyl methyltransferase 1 [Tribolium castaneum]